MAIDSIDHVNVRCTDIGRSISFYEAILGMRAQAAPGQADMNEIAWIIAQDGRSVVHLNREIEGADFLNEDRDWSHVTGSGRVHHVAFECSDYESMRHTLASTGLSLQFNDVPQINLRQIFVHDPDGVLIELNFR